MAGIGLVVRDHHGEFMAGLSKKIPLVKDADHVEALAAVTALPFAL